MLRRLPGKDHPSGSEMALGAANSTVFPKIRYRLCGIALAIDIVYSPRAYVRRDDNSVASKVLLACLKATPDVLMKLSSGGTVSIGDNPANM